MQTWYLIIGIGALLILTSIINSIAESIEQATRERQLKILRFKRSVDNLSDFLSDLNDFDLPEEISKLLQNEIFSRLIQIQNIDSSFHGIDDLIAQSKNKDEDVKEEFDINNLTESELQIKLTLIRKLTNYLHEIPLISTENKVANYHTILMIFRIEKISQFYSKEALLALQNNDFNHAQRYIDHITGAITLSGITNPRLSEINAQAMLLNQEYELRKNQYLQEQDELRRQEEEAKKAQEKIDQAKQ